MTKQFGEQVPEEQAYREAREALRFVSAAGLVRLRVLADTPVKRRALVDEVLSRSLALVNF